MPKHPALACLLILAAALLGGCMTSSSDIGTSLVDVRLEDTAALESTGTVVLRLTNRGNRELNLRGLSAQVYINSELVGEAVSSKPIELGPLSSTEVPLEFSLSHLRLASRLGPALETGVFLYRIEAKLHPKGWMPAIPVSTTGQLDLRHGRQIGSRDFGRP